MAKRKTPKVKDLGTKKITDKQLTTLQRLERDIKETKLDDSREEEQDEEVDELMEIAEQGIEKAEMGLMSRPDMTMTGEE